MCCSGFNSKRGWRSSICQSVCLLHADDRHAVHFKSRYIHIYQAARKLLLLSVTDYHSVAFSVQCGLWALNVSLVVFSVPLSAFGVSHEIQAGSMEGMLQFFMSFWRFFQKHFSLTLITAFLKDLLYVISYGPSQVKPPAVQMLFHYWPNLKPPGAISEYRGLQYTGEMFD